MSKDESQDDLASDLAAERARIDETLGEIQRRLSPGQLVDEVLRHGRGAGSDVVTNLGRTLAANPVPTALIGAGLLWLLLAPKPSRVSADPQSNDRSDAADYQI